MYPAAIWTRDSNGRTPLQLYAPIASDDPHNSIEEIRFLLTKYPKAASLTDVLGLTAYDYFARSQNRSDIERLLLLAAPHLDWERLYDLNYGHRRMALILATYHTKRRDAPETIFSRLSQFSNDNCLMRRVVSFL